MPNKIYLINENITRAILCETCANIVFEKIPHKTIEEENSKKQVYLNNKSIIHQVVVGYTNGWKNVKQYHYIKKEYAVKINEKKTIHLPFKNGTFLDYNVFEVNGINTNAPCMGSESILKKLKYITNISKKEGE